MKKRPFYFEIKNLIVQFMGAFNDIAIKRFDKDRASDGEYIGVGFQYSPKQRVINDLITASRAIPLPAISINISSIARDPERVFNKLAGHILSTSSKEDTSRLIPQPVPINININMSIIARYQADIEQIISNFVPYCDPYITVSWKIPTTENTTYEREIRTIIEWGGTLNMQYPIELAANQLARVTCDTTFTIKGWLFKQIDTAYNKIFDIDVNYIPTDLSSSCYIYNNTNSSNTDDSISLYPELYTVSGKPQLKNIDNIYYFIDKTSDTFVYTLYGKSLINITDFYLKSDNTIFKGGVTLDPFLGTKLQNKYPSFYGVKLNTYKILTENCIEFTIPKDIIHTTGIFDIVVKNDAGYSALSKDSVLPGFSSAVDTTWIKVPYQPACTSRLVAS